MNNNLNIFKLEDESSYLIDFALLKKNSQLEFIQAHKPRYISKDDLTEDKALDTAIRTVTYNDVFIATISNIATGYVYGKQNISDYNSTELFVSERFRKQKIGQRLKEYQIEHARNLNCSEFKSTILKTNTPSIKLHKKLGFRFEETDLEYFVRLKL